MADFELLTATIADHLGEEVTVTVRYRSEEPVLSVSGVLGLAVGGSRTVGLTVDDAVEAESGYFAIGEHAVVLLPDDAVLAHSVESHLVFTTPVVPVEVVLEWSV